MPPLDPHTSSCRHPPGPASHPARQARSTSNPVPVPAERSTLLTPHIAPSLYSKHSTRGPCGGAAISTPSAHSSHTVLLVLSTNLSRTLLRFKEPHESLHHTTDLPDRKHWFGAHPAPFIPPRSRVNPITQYWKTFWCPYRTYTTSS